MMPLEQFNFDLYVLEASILGRLCQVINPILRVFDLSCRGIKVKYMASFSFCKIQISWWTKLPNHSILTFVLDLMASEAAEPFYFNLCTRFQNRSVLTTMLDKAVILCPRPANVKRSIVYGR